MFKRKFLFITLGGVVVLALVATAVWLTSARSPEETADMYLRALKNGDVKKIVELEDPEYQKKMADILEVSVDEYKQFVIRNFDSEIWKEVDFHWEIGETTYSGDLAWVSGTLFVGEDDSAEFNLPLVKRGRNWYLDRSGIK